MTTGVYLKALSMAQINARDKLYTENVLAHRSEVAEDNGIIMREDLLDYFYQQELGRYLAKLDAEDVIVIEGITAIYKEELVTIELFYRIKDPAIHMMIELGQDHRQILGIV